MVISRVIIRATPFRALITLLISPLPLQVGFTEKRDLITFFPMPMFSLEAKQAQSGIAA